MNSSKLFSAALVSLGLILPGVLKAQIVPVLAPGSNWEYTFQNPTGTASWTTSTGGWRVGPAPFGNVGTGGYNGITDFVPGTYWPADSSPADDLWIRRTIDLTSIRLSTISWGLGVDNGYKLYINGQFVSGDFREGYTSRWEYTGTLAPNLLIQGSNVVALALNDTGGLTAFDMQVTGERIPSGAVPEPSTYGLMGAASLAALVGLRRRSVARKSA